MRGRPSGRAERAPHKRLMAGPEQAGGSSRAGDGGGKLRARTRSRTLSLGDRACRALAAARRVSAVTVDRGWAGLDVGMEVVVARG